MPDSEESAVTYDVAVHPDRLELRVTMRLTGEVARGRVRLEIPTWVPGAYKFTPLCRDLFEVKAFITETRAPLRVTRDGWEAFYVEGGTGNVTVTYRAWGYGIDVSQQSGILDSEYAVLLGTRYLHSPAHLGPCTVTYAVPEAWAGTLHHPSGATRLGPTTWRYSSYELLLDTPVTMGRYALLQREVRGTPFYFVFLDGGVGFDAKSGGFVDEVAAIAAGYHTMFGSFPFADYTFVLTLNPALSWGLEHLTSSMCGLGPDVFTDSDDYAAGLRTCAHELFHAWNVRRLRPAPLDHLARLLTRGAFTEGLWVAEGFTRYYEFLAPTRVGAYSAEQFFSNIVGYLQHLTVTPAYHRVSAEGSSYATYLNHPKYPGRPANSIDYYDKGMLIAFGLDASLRMKTPGQSLDRAFAAFYEAYVTGGPGYAGYTTADVITFFEGIQPGLGAMLDRTVNHPGGLTTEALLEELGFTIGRTSSYRLGVMFLDDGAPTLYNVLDDTPAGQSGIAPSDVIVKVNGAAYTPAALAWAATQPETVTLEVLRGQRTLVFTITPEACTSITSLTWNGDDAQAERIRAWLGAFPLTKGEAFATTFYENFHGIETVV